MDLILAAVAQNGLEHASAALQGDLAIVRAATRQNLWALTHASAELQENAELITLARLAAPDAVASGGCALQYASTALQADPELVREAVPAKPRRGPQNRIVPFSRKGEPFFAMMALLAGCMLVCVAVAPPSLPRPSAPQLWYSQGEIMALVVFNMATFVRRAGAAACLVTETPCRLTCC